MGKSKSINTINKYGLIGKSLSHSFSESFFLEKFELLKLLNHSYKNYELSNEKDLADFLLEEALTLKGFNITIPYKESIIPYLDTICIEAEKIQAVNCVKIENGKLLGYNTDVFGFSESLKPLLKKHHKKALILGTGGASKAIVFVLNSLGIEYTIVSRTKKENSFLLYKEITKEIITSHAIIINCTPVGTFPNIDEFPLIPYEYMNESHIAYDLVYNPKTTSFLQKANKQGATILNGSQMLVLQAERSWEIWNT